MRKQAKVAAIISEKEKKVARIVIELKNEK